MCLLNSLFWLLVGLVVQGIYIQCARSIHNLVSAYILLKRAVALGQKWNMEISQKYYSDCAQLFRKRVKRVQTMVYAFNDYS